MRVKEFIDPNTTFRDIVKGINVGANFKKDLLKGTAWDKDLYNKTGDWSQDKSKKTQPAAKTAPAQSRSASKSSPEVNKSKITKNIVSPNDLRSYILSKGLSRNHAAGILANIRAESGFNSAAFNPDDLGARSIGLFQHRATRADKLEKSVPDWRTNWRGQIDFALSESEGQQYTSTKFRTPQDAAKWFTIHFERPRNRFVVANTRATSATQYA